MVQEFTKNLIDEYLKEEIPENINFERSVLESLIRDGEKELFSYCIENGFDQSKILKYFLQYGSPEWFKEFFEDHEHLIPTDEWTKNIFMRLHVSMKARKWVKNNSDMIFFIERQAMDYMTDTDFITQMYEQAYSKLFDT